jgi:hypothetical protein
MKIKKFLFILSFTFTSVFGFDLQVPELLYRPVGKYLYQNDIQITKKRTAETVSHMSSDGQNRIKQLKKNGFFCVRKNQIDSICQKNELNVNPIPDYVQNAVDQYFHGAELFFPGVVIPELTFDGATQEWFVRETILIGKGKVDMYKIVNTNDEIKKWYLTLPISENNGIGLIEIKNQSTLAIPLVLQAKSEGQTVGYFIDAQFQHLAL